MVYRSLMSRTESISMWLSLLNNFTHLLLLLLGEFNLSRCPIFLQPIHLSRAGNGNHALSGDPGEGNLTDRASFLGGKLFDLLNNCTILVEVLALEFGRYMDKMSAHITYS